jgi:hypothetical protein
MRPSFSITDHIIECVITQDPTNEAEDFITTESERNELRMRDVLRRNVAAWTFPQHPSPSPTRSEDIPGAAKRPRVEPPFSASVDVALASQRIDRAPTSSHIDWIVVASSSSSTANYLEPAVEDDKSKATQRRRTGKWNAVEDARLTEAVKKHENSWVAIAQMVPDRDHSQCHSRWTKSLEPRYRKTIRMGRWTAAEDAKLTEAVLVAGKNWAAVASMIPGRTNSQCNSRWAKNLELKYIKTKWKVPPQQQPPQK